MKLTPVQNQSSMKNQRLQNMQTLNNTGIAQIVTS